MTSPFKHNVCPSHCTICKSCSHLLWFRSCGPTHPPTWPQSTYCWDLLKCTRHAVSMETQISRPQISSGGIGAAMWLLRMCSCTHPALLANMLIFLWPVSNADTNGKRLQWKFKLFFFFFSKPINNTGPSSPVKWLQQKFSKAPFSPT